VGIRFACVAALVVLLFMRAGAENLLAYATVKEISAKSVTVALDSGPQTAIINDKTHAYRKMAVVAPSEFLVGDRVRVRIKLDGKEPVLREIMDAASEKWIDRIRHEYIRAEVKSTEPGKVTVKLDDETEFTYKITPSTKIEQKGMAVGGSALTPGATFWVKGKGLSSLDTQLSHATDAAPDTKPTTKTNSKTKLSDASPPPSAKERESKAPTKSTKSSYSNRLPYTTTADGTVDLVLSNLGQLDLKVAGRLMHFRWTPRTQFFIGENPAGWQDLTIGLPVTVYYFRDGVGRLVLSRVQLP